MTILFGLYAYFSEIQCPDGDELSLPTPCRTEMMLPEPEGDHGEPAGDTPNVLSEQ